MRIEAEVLRMAPEDGKGRGCGSEKGRFPSHNNFLANGGTKKIGRTGIGLVDRVKGRD
jgi:hypothetical protein